MNQLPISLIKQIIGTIRYFIHGLSSAMDANNPSKPETNDEEHERMDVETGGRVRTRGAAEVVWTKLLFVG